MGDGDRAGVPDLVAAHVQRAPDAPAVHDPLTGEVLSYAELWRSAGALAAALTDRGVGRGDIVGIHLGRSVDLVVAMLGITRAAAAYLCLDADAPPDRHSSMLAQAEAALVVHPRTGAGEDAGGIRGLRLVRPAAVRPAAHPPAESGATRADDPIYVVFTSGSTGEPKGVVIPHRAVRRLAVAPNFCTIGPGDRVANGSNPAFDATTFEVWSTLVAGGTVVVVPALAEATFTGWSRLLVDAGITTMFLTTPMFLLIARERPDAFRRLRTLLFGGEHIDAAVLRRVLEEGAPDRLVNVYGPTEATTFATYFECTEESLTGREKVPIGSPIQDTSLQIVDDRLQPVAPGNTGELCIGGPGLALGYLGRPDLTAQRFVAAPAKGQRLYRTGDLARLLPTDAVELLGRVDRQVKLWGFRIELVEIEAAIMATGMVDAAFVEKRDEGPDAMLIGFVLPARTAGTDLLPAVRAALVRRLPGYMVPARWVVLSEVPLGPTGKVDRRQLVAMLPGAVD